MAETFFKLSNIDAFYGDVQVLRNVSVEIQEGEIVALLGANAAGKTTTLRIISKLLSPAAGSMEFRGKRINDLKAHEIVTLGISQVPDDRSLFPLMSVMENLELGALHPRARAKAGENLEWIFQLFPILRDRKKQMAGTMSGGQQQMLAIGRALMACPSLLLLDEPSQGLAPIIVDRIREVICEINRQGITILLVEQYVAQTLAIANRGYVMENGRIVLEGNSKNLLNNEHVQRAYLGIA